MDNREACICTNKHDTAKPVFEEVRRIVVNKDRSHPQRNMTQYFFEHAQAYPEYMVENGADAWRGGQG